MNKLKLLVASALLSSTAVYAEDCTETNCGIDISGNQTIDLGSSIDVNDVTGININSISNTLTIDGDITVNSNIDSARGISITNSPASNNVINMIGNISTISSGGAVKMHGILLNDGASNNTVNVTGNVSTSGINSSGVIIYKGSDNNNVTLTGDINLTGTASSFGVRLYGTSGNVSDDNVVTVNGDINTVNISIFLSGFITGNNIIVNGNVQSTNNAGIAITGTDTINNIVTVNGNVSTSSTSSNATITFDKGATDNLVVINGNVTQLSNSAALRFGAAGADTSHDNTVSVSGNITSAGVGIRFKNSDNNEIFVSGNIESATSAIYADSDSDNNTVYLDRNSRIEGAIRNDGTGNTLLFTAWEPIEPEDTDGDGVPDIDGDIDFEEISSGGQSQYGLATSANYTVSGTSPWVVQANVEQPVLTGNTYIKSMGVANIDDEGNRLYLRTSKINQNFEKKKINYLNSRIENIRVIKGTNYDYFSDEGKKNFLEKEFIVSKLSDRMGMRLEGPKIENIVNTNIK